MRGQVIGERMPHGYAGSYARQPDLDAIQALYDARNPHKRKETER